MTTEVMKKQQQNKQKKVNILDCFLANIIQLYLINQKTFLQKDRPPNSQVLVTGTSNPLKHLHYISGILADPLT